MSHVVPTLTFVGGAQTVTGSKTLLDTATGRVLVDCGLFQGRKKLRLQNWAPLPVPPETIDAVVLTHAHIDHCGYVPRLVAQGFRGPIYCTEGTRRLAQIVLPDSGYLQEEEAAFANRVGYSKHSPALPLYTRAQAEECLGHFETVAFEQPHQVVSDVAVTWQRAGHILGAASLGIEFGDEETRVVFSGDLGRGTHPLLVPPAPIGPANVVVAESTYGDEDHPANDLQDQIGDVINRVCRSGGVLLIPAFAVDRTEIVLWHIEQLLAAGRIPDIPVFVDSPMASSALEVYRSEARNGSPEISSELHGTELFPSINLTETRTATASKALNSRRGPMIIISASGMATGGRIIHHLANRIGDHRNEILLVGFQAPGTRGDALRSGARQIKMFGHYHPVRAGVTSIALSAHADQSELIDWIETAEPPPEIVYVNHGELASAAAFVDKIQSLGIMAVAPRQGERLRLDRRP